MKNRERLVRFTADGGVVANREIVEKNAKQKNYVIDVEVADGIKALAKELGAKNESQMIEEMYYTFMELLERGKQEQKKAVKKATKKEVKEEK